MSYCQFRAFHSSRITSNDKVRSTSRSTRFCMELYFGRSCVYHGCRPNSHDCFGWVETSRMFKAGIQHFFMLFHSHIQWNIIFLGPTTQRTQPKYWILVSFLLQVFTRTSHQISMTRMCGVTSLERINSISTLFTKFIHEFTCCFTPLVQSIIVFDTIQQFNFTTDQIISTLVNFLNVGMAHINHTKHTCGNLFLPIGINFRVAQYSHNIPHLRRQRHSTVWRILNRRLGVLCTTQGNGNTHRYSIGGTEFLELFKVGSTRVHILIIRQVEWIDQNGIEMKHFQQSPLPHESLQGGSPTFTNHLQPIQVQISNENLWQSLRLCHPFLPQMSRNMQINLLIPIRIGQSRRCQLGRTLQNPIHLQPTEQNIRTLFNFQLVSFQCNLRMQRWFIRVINTGKMFQFSTLHTSILSLWITLLQLIDGNIQKDFIKGNTLLFMSLPYCIPITTVGTNQPH
mmetsp:Transcript_7292/g.11479  ORF Transcript_7292/g.11479 Transcript_7292/m.11479 type:complete len:454 (-) Transcript_7292:2075-3436(-)